MKSIFGKISIAVPVILIFVFLPQLIDRTSVEFSASTGFYLFNALLQANAAIVAIVGVFSIFRIQSYQSATSGLRGTLMSDPGIHSRPETIIEFDNLSYQEKISE